jgi:hypothetical protein
MSREQVSSESDDRTVNNTLRHNYRILDESEKADMVDIKDAGLAFLKVLDRFPSSREMSLARTKIEEAVMWAVKHVTK